MNSIVPVYSFPSRTNNERENGPAFSARPLKHWRKQYQERQTPYRVSASTSIGILTDRPGSYNRVATKEIQCETCNNTVNINIKTDSIKRYVESLGCLGCQSSRIKPNTQLSETMYNTTASYLKARCLNYEQHETSVPADNTILFNANHTVTQPTDLPTGPQVRETINCMKLLEGNVPCNTTIYKPNNMQYAQQGGVSASSRLARLKYNTLNRNGSVFTSAAGAVNANSGRYQTEPSPSYVVKYKPQPYVYTYKAGSKNSCNRVSLQECN